MANTNPNKSTVSVQAQAQALVSKACKAAYQQASNAAFSLPVSPAHHWVRVVRLAADLLEEDLAQQVRDLRQKAKRMRIGSHARVRTVALASALASEASARVSLDREYAIDCKLSACRDLEAEYAKNWR